MTVLWIIIVTQQSLLGSTAYIGTGAYIHPTEEGCHEEANRILSHMTKAGHKVTVTCERLPLEDR